MSHPPGPNQPRRSAPLIARPSSRAPPAPHPPPRGAPRPSALGAAIHGALGGAHYHPAAPQYPYPAAPPPTGWNATAHHPHQLGQPHLGQPPAFPPQPHYAQQHGQGLPYGYGPPSGPPPQHAYAAQPPPPAPFAQPYPLAYHDHQPFLPPPPAPAHYAAASQAQTTPDGYTLSSTYSGPAHPAPSSSSSRAARPAAQPRQQQPQRAPKQPREPQQPQVVACSQAGCTFSGPRKVVREHEEDRHLIYLPGKEPKGWDGSLKPKEGAVIEGTGIALDTPEAVARWIEERKKRWPSKKVVDEKERARAQRVAAGLEAPPRERNGARGRGRGRGGPTDSRGRGRGRGGFGGGEGGRDGGWGAGEAGEGGPAPAGEEQGRDEPPVKRARVDGPAAATVGDEQPDSSSDEDGGQEASEGSADEDEEDDGPPEQASAKEALGDVAVGEETMDVEDGSAGAPVDGEASGAAPQKRFQVVCHHWRRGNCGLGDDCPYLHEIPPASARPPPPPKRRRPAPPRAPHNPFARPPGYADAFSLLEERDYKHVVSDVLQVIEFLGANEWLRGVEMRRGQVDEESGIEVLREGEVGEGAAVGGAGRAAGIEELGSAVEDAAPGSPSSSSSASSSSSSTSSTPSSPAAAPAPALAPVPASPPLAVAARAPAVAAVPAPAAASMSGLGAMFADYGSDTDDEAEDESVAAALTGRTL
ncbi:uncharacterized protein RHOBADRAFT_50707 [Rhodotorula graminis WP1]|uniref:C3H1-type domain-containing protein n=1 Tax=Rhodotorula graminis (strain WP1) TaxID=578459 RepID=A0A194SBV4_RHOGW|nr:uncharacterized protein RHOBADRAFT_50707 [Rhodotorula graminis WP1]KPV78213.1 hypothetical protein RHOBADRAFT_50707 [Rhodotorula graminis WP1]